MPSTPLFHENPEEIKPAEGRGEPSVWVRRLRLVEDLSADGRVIRDIEFRRGLNIICTERAGPQDQQVVGHSVGKTLLLRLIRYCLGEHAFCTKAVRSALAAVLEDAYVSAEVRVAGSPWVVARPIGLDTRRPSSWAMQGDDLAALNGGPDGAARFTDFVRALEEATARPFAGVGLPHADREANWLDLLAWLSRDQECRFRHQSEWRDPDSESRTAQLQIEDASLVMRMAMDLLGEEEKRLQVAHRRLLADKRQLGSEITRLEMFLDAEEEELRRILKVDGDILAGELFASTACDKAGEKQEELKGLLAEQEADKTVEKADRWRVAVVAEVAALRERKKEAEGKIEAERTLLRQLEEADAETYYASLAPLGQRWCRLFQTEDEAKKHGCPGQVAAALKPGERDPEQAARITEGYEHVGALEKQISEFDTELAAKTEERDRAEREYQKCLQRRFKAIGEIRQRIGWWQEVGERANRYGECWARLTRKHASREALDKKIEESNEKQRQARLRLERKRAQLSAYFDYVLKTLISADAGGDVLLESRGIIPHPNEAVAASGQALSTSAMVLGFDFACMIGYVCDLGHLPGLFLHDSPREADMEDALYYRLFHLAADLERRFERREPSFQYIVATTTPPPSELDCDPYVRLRLDARTDAGRLLGFRF